VKERRERQNLQEVPMFFQDLSHGFRAGLANEAPAGHRVFAPFADRADGSVRVNGTAVVTIW